LIFASSSVNKASAKSEESALEQFFISHRSSAAAIFFWFNKP
jgi:hypothetical protein